jgi:hypothetical protein
VSILDVELRYAESESVRLAQFTLISGVHTSHLVLEVTSGFKGFLEMEDVRV